MNRSENHDEPVDGDTPVSRPRCYMVPLEVGPSSGLEGEDAAELADIHSSAEWMVQAKITQRPTGCARLSFFNNFNAESMNVTSLRPCFTCKVPNGLDGMPT